MAEKYALERRKATVLKHILAGMSDAQVAGAISSKTLTVSPQAVTQFRERHSVELQQSQAELIATVKRLWIADKDARMSEIQWWYEQTREEAERDGLTIVEQVVTVDKHGAETTVITKDYRASMVREARGLLRQAAEEKGQLPKAGDVIVNPGEGSRVLIVTSEEALNFG